MPPLGNPSAMSYSRSSARSDLKIFTFPLASYNFRMRAICDVSDIRTFLRLMLMAHSRATPGSAYRDDSIEAQQSEANSDFDLSTTWSRRSFSYSFSGRGLSFACGRPLLARGRVGEVPPVGKERGVFDGFFFPAEMAGTSNKID